MEVEGPKNSGKKEKEGFGLVGGPHYEDIGNGRLRCIETGHELPSQDADSYGNSKKCRQGLIDHALKNKKAPLNSFDQSPIDKSKLICKLTGDIVNKSEEHIWKHISGRKFQKKLAEKEAARGEKNLENGLKSKKIKINVKEEENVELLRSNSIPDAGTDSKSDSEEPDFWIPPVGDRWDLDDGRDRWEDLESSKTRQKKGQESIDDDSNDIDEGNCVAGDIAEYITVRTKRMSMAVGPSSFASQKKKRKTNDKSIANQEKPWNK